MAVWGHISDGNLHANVLARSYAEVEAGRAAILDVGRQAIRLGGSPLAEHGVGRSRLKQQLLEELYGASRHRGDAGREARARPAMEAGAGSFISAARKPALTLYTARQCC